MINKITDSAIQGMQRGMHGMRKRAQDIATAPIAPAPALPARGTGEPAPDLARSLVEMKQYALEFKANAKVLKTASETIGALLDTKA